MMRQVYRRMVTAIHREEEHRLNRRAFLHMMFLGSAAIGLSSIPLATLARWAQRSGPKSSPTPEGVPIAKSGDIPAGEAMNFNWPTAHDPAVLVHLPEGKFVAYDRKCTHLQCPVLWDKDQNQLVCPCHDGHFDARTGDVISGPPQRPLPQIDIEEREGTIYVLGKHLRGVKTDAP